MVPLGTAATPEAMLSWDDGLYEGFRVGAAYCVGCFVCHFICSKLLGVLTKVFNLSIERSDEDDFHNRMVAAIHAAIMFLGTASFLLPRADLSQWPTTGVLPAPVHGLEPYAESPAIHLNDIMIGYLVYDTVFICCTPSMLKKWDWGVFLHHVFGLASESLVRLTGHGNLYMMWTHFAEGSTPFLHMSFILKKSGCSSSPLFLPAAAMCLLMFTATRILSGPISLAHFWQYRETWPVEWMMWYQMSTVAFFCLLNFYWWTLLIKMAKRSMGGGGGDSKKKD